MCGATQFLTGTFWVQFFDSLDMTQAGEKPLPEKTK